jgi:hypothetical protein
MEESKEILTQSGDADFRSEGTRVASNTDTAREYMARFGRRVKDVAARVREKSLHEAVRNTTNKVADKLETAGNYFQERKFKDVVGDLVKLVRKYPMQLLLAGAGLGLFLSRKGKK